MLKALTSSIKIPNTKKNFCFFSHLQNKFLSAENPRAEAQSWLPDFVEMCGVNLLLPM